MGRKAAEDVDDERGLLLELALGKKTFEQVAVDARRLVRKGADLSALTGSNAARCITQRLQELTGISKDSLHFFDVRCKPGTADPGLAGEKMKLPFILLSTHIEQLIAKDQYYFEADLRRPDGDIAASSFLNSREYINHELVQHCYPLGETVVPVGLYSDGISVGMDPHGDSLYAVYIYFLNRPPKEAGRPEAKFVYTVYRKSEATPETLQDIWRVLLWELQALQHGRKALLGQEGVRLEDQVPGDYVGQRWGRWHKAVLMQIKGDWSWYLESMGVRQWNSTGHMCPFCAAHGRGPLRWSDFSFDAPWRGTSRTQARFLTELQDCKAQNFRPGSGIFKFEPLLCRAPYFRWSMLKLDWMHAADLGLA